MLTNVNDRFNRSISAGGEPCAAIRGAQAELMQTSRDLIPTLVVTGFLGAGKTTLINRLLSGDVLQDALIIVNEFGEVGIDQALIERSDDGMYLLQNGCVCCSSRGDLSDTLMQIGMRIRCNTIAPFSRVIVETSGVANPAPLYAALCSARVSEAGFRPVGIVAVVNGVQGMEHLRLYSEARNQVALADITVMSMSDLTSETERGLLQNALSNLNPTAAIIAGDVAEAALVEFFNEDRPARLVIPQPLRFVAESVHSFTSHVVTRKTPVAWPDFAGWLASVASLRGDQMLRVKGVVRTHEYDQPVLIQGSHHWLSPPRLLDRWPDAIPDTRLVFITADAHPHNFQESFQHAVA